MKLELDLKEVQRYLNYQGELDSNTKANIDKGLVILEDIIRPKYLARRFDISNDNNKVIIKDTSIIIESKSLSKHLIDCDEIIILVATLGLALDQEIKKLEINDIGLAYVINALATEYIEKYLDYLQLEILPNDKYHSSRYSIGYGDVDLKYQNDILSLLNSAKLIGVNLLDSNLMVPSKSITAIIGLSSKKIANNLSKCHLCLPNGKCSGKCLEVNK
ncbi:MAG: hypothetical protein LBR40_02510 [Bacilli bacterium]|nr:hypothetical protein [Bacilli bacterium]